MQHMPDKEFDKLFKDKFNDAEIEPSIDLWANIEKELAPKKKRVIPIYWMAAASVAVAITAMLVFQKKEVIQLHGQDPVAKVNEIKSTDILDVTTEIVTPATKTAKVMVAKAITPAAKSSTKEIATPRNNNVENNLQNIQIAMQPIQNKERLPIKQQDPKPIDVLPKEVVKTENPIVTATHVEKQVNEVDRNEISESGTSERKGIRNVGDLVNFVVDKVDKRDKKLVRFNTDDDDNSSIVGINIGFLKFNKKNKDK
jgi:hypothetical protein